jgi:hypothetical protein
LPWAVIPVPGFLAAFWLADRYRNRFRDQSGWRGKLAIFLDAIHLVSLLFRHPVRHAPAELGMAAFWLAEALMGWTALACFGFHRLVSLWVPMPFALGRLRLLREMGPGDQGTLDHPAAPTGEPAVDHHAG